MSSERHGQSCVCAVGSKFGVGVHISMGSPRKTQCQSFSCTVGGGSMKGDIHTGVGCSVYV